jgi:hypothetical protein
MLPNGMQLFKPTWKTTWIKTTEELKSSIEWMMAEEKLGVDTETAGWQVGNETLCLVQVGMPTRKEVLLIDPLTIPDLAPMLPVLEESGPLKIAHNGSFEKKQFERYKLPYKNTADTFFMAKELRADLPGHSLRACCREILGFDLSKAEQTSDWFQRPLTFSQTEYAVSDAEVAVYLYDALKEFEDLLYFDPELEMEELMGILRAARDEHYALTRAVAKELALCLAKQERLKSCIKERLEAGEPAYEGVFGEAKMNQSRKFEINPAKLREVFPEFAEDLIRETVEKKALLEALEARGFSKKRMDEVNEVVGFTNRLSIKLSDSE